MLIFPLKKEWYEKIKSGEKTIEYREVKLYWIKRIMSEVQNHNYIHGYKACDFKKNMPIDVVRFNIPMLCKLRLGYTNRYIIANISMIEIVDGKDTDLHIDKPVYAIHLADVMEIE